MSRSTTKKTTKPLPPPEQRPAAPVREWLALSPRSSSVASALATAAALGSAAGGLPPAVTAAAATAVVGAVGARVKGRTLAEWVSLRRGMRARPQQAALFERDRAGIVFDGRTLSVCVEITPRPWQLTTVTATGVCEAPVISADQLRRQLVQYDIHCSRLTAICAGYKFAARDDAAGVLDTLIGPVSTPLGGTTVIVVSLDLEADALGPAYRRAPKEADGEPSLPGGLCRTAILAATRVCNSLAENGFGGRLMNAQQVRDFHDEVLAQVAAPLENPGWDRCGSLNGVHTRTYSPARGHWNEESAGAWHHLQSHRQYTTLTLTPHGEGQALAQPLITYLVKGGEPLSKASGYGLQPAVGQQIAGLAQALPAAARVSLSTPGAVIDEKHRLGFGVPSGGAGLFVGSRADRSRVFVAISPSADPLWLCGPTLFAMQMVARLSTQDQRIAVMIDDPAWQSLVDHRRTPTLTANSLNEFPADVVVTTPQWWERNRDRCADKAVILVTGERPGRLASHSLAVTTDSEGTALITVDVDDQQTTVGWELTPIEKRLLLGDVDPDSPVVPTIGASLVLSEIVQLPATAVSAPAPKRTRREIPADAVPTLAVISPEDLHKPTPALDVPRPKEWATAPVAVAAPAAGELRLNETVSFPGANGSGRHRRDEE